MTGALPFSQSWIESFQLVTKRLYSIFAGKKFLIVELNPKCLCVVKALDQIQHG